MGTYYPSHNYGPEHAAAIGATPKPAISQARLDANRRNARKSTGPRTEEGKARASRNAMRHGLTGQISVQTEEDRIARDAFCKPIIADLKPQGALEEQLAFAIAEQHWRLNRARSMEDNIFALGHYGPAGDIDVDHPELHGALTSARVFLESGKAFELLTLYEQRIQRNVHKDMAKLEELQAKRRAARAEALEEAAQVARVAEHEGERAQPEIEAGGFIFSNEEVKSRNHRNRRLKQFRFHERNHWIETIQFPEAA